MKKFSTIVIIFLTLSLSLCYSQNFKAKDGLDKAKTSSKINNPELLLCASYNGTIQGIPTSLVFDINSGTSNVWFYYLRSADDHNIKKLMLCTYLFGLVSYEIPVTGIIDSLPYEPSGSLNDIQWIDSDVMSSDLKSSQGYQDFVTAHSDADISLVTLSYNGDYPYLPIGNAYWIVKIDASNSTSLLCAVNAVSSEVTCFDEPTSVNDFNDVSCELKIYPNPAKDNIFITIPENIQIKGSLLEIFDAEGNLAYNFNVKPIAGINVISVPILLLSNGQYFIKLTTNERILLGKIVIVRQ